MKSSFLQRLDMLTRGTTPVLITLFLVILAQVPLRIPGFSEVVPILPLMAVYHWTLYRPDLLPVVAVFFVGLLHDALSGMPFGVNALVFVLVHMAVLSQQAFFQGRSFLIVWLGFALVAAGAIVLIWVLNTLFFAAMVPLQAVFVQYAVTVGVYPILAWLMSMWKRSMLTQV